MGNCQRITTGLLLAAMLLEAQATSVEGRSDALPASPPAGEVKPEDKCTVEGTVVNAVTGEPIRKAQVMPIRGGGRQQAGPPAGAITDAGGKFKIVNLDPGQYRLMATRNGYARSWFGPRPSGRAAPMLTLDKGQTLRGVVLKLTPAAVISGRVTDEDGEPVVEAQIQALRSRYMNGKRQLLPEGNASTDDLGNYRMHSLEPGRYYVKASYMGARMDLGQEQSYQPVYHPGVPEASQAAPLEVRGGEEARAIDFRLVRSAGVRVRGRITNPPASSRFATVMLTSSDGMFGREFQPSRIDPKGNFELRGVAPGAYSLVAIARDRENQLVARMPLQVPETGVEGIEVTLRPGVEVRGTLRMEGGSPPAADLKTINVVLGGSPGPFAGSQHAEVGEDGSFTIPRVWDGSYRLQVMGLPEGAYVKAARAGQTDVLAEGLAVVDGVAPGPLDVVVSFDGGSIDGTVVDGEKKAVSGATVTLVPASKRERTDLYRSAVADQNGRYTLSGVAPGDYLMFAWESVEQGAWQDPLFLEPLKDKGRKITVGEKSRQTVELEALPASVADR
jgi:protocatechuate 3,4-dioxygenase beta subunit